MDPVMLQRRMKANAERLEADLPERPQGYVTYREGAVAREGIDCSGAEEPNVSIWAIGQVQRLTAVLAATSRWRLVRRWRLRRELRSWRDAVSR